MMLMGGRSLLHNNRPFHCGGVTGMICYGICDSIASKGICFHLGGVDLQLSLDLRIQIIRGYGAQFRIWASLLELLGVIPLQSDLRWSVVYVELFRYDRIGVFVIISDRSGRYIYPNGPIPSIWIRIWIPWDSDCKWVVQCTTSRPYTRYGSGIREPKKGGGCNQIG